MFERSARYEGLPLWDAQTTVSLPLIQKTIWGAHGEVEDHFNVVLDDLVHGAESGDAGAARIAL